MCCDNTILCLRCAHTTQSAGQSVKAAIDIVGAGVKIAKEGYDAAAPVIKQGVDAVAPVVNEAVKVTTETAAPLLEKATPVVKVLLGWCLWLLHPREHTR